MSRARLTGKMSPDYYFQSDITTIVLLVTNAVTCPSTISHYII